MVHAMSCSLLDEEANEEIKNSLWFFISALSNDTCWLINLLEEIEEQETKINKLKNNKKLKYIMNMPKTFKYFYNVAHIIVNQKE